MKTEYRDENFKLMPTLPETDKYRYQLSNSYYHTENYLNEEYFDSHFYSGKFSDTGHSHVGISTGNQLMQRIKILLKNARVVSKK
ncbi:hypothetical protein [Chryseobacterium shigense]|uniref:Uncharacterized protein n=1 Tax=Chryseobacterium shigense TaxID=297244 RepID=A0A841N7F0_9FLAO|nr:hypothetical protein [Chryseobacterium shigense]MBB6369408.1 hypothetical protein [Chryseobacterium shigense]